MDPDNGRGVSKSPQMLKSAVLTYFCLLMPNVSCLCQVARFHTDL